MAGLYFSSGIDKGFENDLKRMNKQMNEFADNTVQQNQEVSKSFGGVGSAIAGVVTAAAIGAAGKELINFSRDLETSLTEVATISGEVTANFDIYKQSLLDLSTQSDLAGSSAKQLSDGFYDIVSAGYDGAAGLKILEVAARAGTAGFVDVGVAADGVTTVLNAWGKSADEAASVSDIFFKTVEKGKTTFPELGANIAKIAPIAASMGISFEEASGAIASITKQGTKTPEALTQIRASMIAVNKVLGDGWAEAYTFQEALQEVANAAGGSQNKLKELVGTDEAVLAVLALTGDNARGAAEDLDAMTNALGATEAAAAKVAATADNQIKLLTNNILAALEPLGAGAVDVIGSLAESLNEAFASGNIEIYAKAIGTIVAAYGAYKGALIASIAFEKLKAASAVQAALAGRALSTWEIIHTGIIYKLNAAQKAVNATMASNPYGLALAAIMLLVGAVILYNKSAEESVIINEDLAEVSRQTVKNLENETSSLRSLQAQLKASAPGSEQRKKVMAEINKQYPTLLKNIDTENASLGELNLVFDAYVKNLEKTIRLKVLQSKLEGIISEEAESNNIENVNERYAALQALDARKKALQDEITYQKNMVDVSQKYADLIKEQTVLLKDQAETSIIADFEKELQTYEEFVANYKLVRSKLNDGELSSPVFTKKELDEAYTNYVNNQDRVVAARKAAADKLAYLGELIDAELVGRGLVDEAESVEGEINEDKVDKRQKDLEALEISNKKRINEIKQTALTELKTQEELNNDLLAQQLIYLEKKKNLSTDAEKLTVEGQILDININRSEDEKQAVADDKKKLNDLLAQFETYTQERTRLETEYLDAANKLRAEKDEDRAKQAELQLQRELKRLDESFLSSNEAFQNWIEGDFKDIAAKGVEALGDELSKLKLNITGKETAEQLLVYNAQLKLIDDKIKEINSSVDNQGQTWKDSLELINGVNELASTLAESLADVDKETSNILNGIVKTSAGFINLGQSIKAVGSAVGTLEKASAILSVLTAAVQVISAISTAIDAAAAEREAKLVANLAAINETNIALIEQNRLYKEGNELFSSDKWGTALKGLDSYNKALDYQNEATKKLADLSLGGQTKGNVVLETLNPLYARSVGASKISENRIDQRASFYQNDLQRGLAGVAVKTTSASSLSKTFGGSDEFKSLLDLYPKLIDGSGKLNVELLQTIVNTEKISDVDKQRLTNLINANKAAEESFDQFGSYISSQFGGVADEITQAFQTMYENIGDGGSDAMKSLEASFSTMIEGFTRDAIEFAFLQPIISELNDATKVLGSKYASGDISASDLTSGVTSALGSFYQEVNGLQPSILEAFAEADRLAAGAGFDSAFNADAKDAAAVEDTTTKSLSVGGQVQQAITEETGSMLVGRMGAIMISNQSLLNNSNDALDFAIKNLVTLNAIKQNTDYLPEIAANTKKTYEKLSSI